MPIEPAPAVLRAGDVLAQLAQQPGASFSVSELARRVGVPRATCDAILQALSAHRLVTRRDDDLCYELGPGCIALGEAARSANPPLRAASSAAERLARELASSVAVCVREGDTARVAEVYDFGPVFSRRTRVGQTIPLVPPFGAVFVAWSDADSEAWLARGAAELEPAERARYRRALHEVRRRGYSLSVVVRGDAELAAAVEAIASPPASDAAQSARDALIREIAHSEYLAADLDARRPLRVGQISAPVFDASGAVTVSLLTLGPEHESHGAAIETLARRLVEATTRATRLAGGREPTPIAEEPPARRRSGRTSR